MILVSSKIQRYWILVVSLYSISVGSNLHASPNLSTLSIPAGFHISIFSDKVPGARSLTSDDKGNLYVGTLKEGRVYELKDENHDGQADVVNVVAQGLNSPNGVAWHQGDLYIGEISRILKLSKIAEHPNHPVRPTVIYDHFPSDRHHGYKYLRIGPDHKLYTAIGQPCNICNLPDEIYGSIVHLDLDGTHVTTVARGFRNSVGFDFHPATQELWATDNGRDWLGDDSPPDELNLINKPQLHFGFPFCFGRDLRDPEYGHLKSCHELTPPRWEFPAHVAALGLRFYNQRQFPKEYQQQLFVAQHGSWNRTQPQGYRIVMLRFENGEPIQEIPFIEGFLQKDGKVTGRPVDVLVASDGALFISDDYSGVIYRVVYEQPTKH